MRPITSGAIITAVASVQADTTAILADTEELLEHFHGTTLTYPNIGAGGAWVQGTAIAAGGVGAGVFGLAVTVLPAVATANPFDIHWLAIELLPANTTYELVLLNGATELARVRFTRVTNQESINGLPVMCPVVAAGTAITARCANAAGNTGTMRISLQYHEYP